MKELYQPLIKTSFYNETNMLFKNVNISVEHNDAMIVLVYEDGTNEFSAHICNGDKYTFSVDMILQIEAYINKHDEIMNVKFCDHRVSINENVGVCGNSKSFFIIDKDRGLVGTYDRELLDKLNNIFDYFQSNIGVSMRFILISAEYEDSFIQIEYDNEEIYRFNSGMFRQIIFQWI